MNWFLAVMALIGWSLAGFFFLGMIAVMMSCTLFPTLTNQDDPFAPWDLQDELKSRKFNN